MKTFLAALILAFAMVACTNTNIDEDHNKQCKENCNVISSNPTSVVVQPTQPVVVQPVEVQERVKIVEKVVEVPVYIDRASGEELQELECQIVYSTGVESMRVGHTFGFDDTPGHGGGNLSFYKATHVVSGSPGLFGVFIGLYDPLRYCPATGELTAGGVIFAVVPN